MHTNDDDADLERVEFDFSRARLVNRPRSPEGFAIAIDRAVGYSLRLIPSNKILGRFVSTRELQQPVPRRLAACPSCSTT